MLCVFEVGTCSFFRICQLPLQPSFFITKGHAVTVTAAFQISCLFDKFRGCPYSRFVTILYGGVSFFWIFFSNLISHTIQNSSNRWNEASNLDWQSLIWICNDMSGWRTWTSPEIASLNLQFAPLHVNLPPDCALIYAGQTLTRSHVSKSPGSNSPLLLPTNSLSQPGAVATTCSVP